MVTHNNQVLFKPEWGIYDMAVGKEIISAYAGPADINSFENLGKLSATKTHKITYSSSEKELYELYEKVIFFREKDVFIAADLMDIFVNLKTKFENDWLLSLELYELAVLKNLTVQYEFLTHLQNLQKNKNFYKLITDGLALISINN